MVYSPKRAFLLLKESTGRPDKWPWDNVYTAQHYEYKTYLS